jgi:hypothetical protein
LRGFAPGIFQRGRFQNGGECGTEVSKWNQKLRLAENPGRSGQLREQCVHREPAKNQKQEISRE